MNKLIWHLLYILAIIGNFWAITEGRWTEATYCVVWLVYYEIKIRRADNE